MRARAAEALAGWGSRAGEGRGGDGARRDSAGAPLVAIRGDDPGSATDPWLELRLGLFALARLKDAPAAERALLRDGRPRFDWWAATWRPSAWRARRCAPCSRQRPRATTPSPAPSRRAAWGR